jgi:hypothetical protein
MTTTSQNATAWGPVGDRRRAMALRWLLELATAGNLPTPTRIEFGGFVMNRRKRRFISVSLADNADLTGWAAAIDATRADDFHVVGHDQEWTLHTVATAWAEGSRVAWHSVDVSTRRDIRPLRTDAGIGGNP